VKKEEEEKEGEEGKGWDGPFAHLQGVNVNEEIMDREEFDCFGQFFLFSY
jgi:hypothetical protein